MSNPAVAKLVRDKIGGLSFWMDDNIGESVHIHLADFRMDLTINELNMLNNDLHEIINSMVDIEGFDCKNIDSVYLSRFLAPMLRNLVAVKIDTVKLGDLKVCYNVKANFTKYVDIANSRAVKALNGDARENNDIRSSNHIGQSSQDRLDYMYESVKEKGYPFNNQYIILYNDQMLIRDGQHRASCLYVQHGNIEIPVMRLYFNDLEDISYVESYFAQFVEKIKGVKFKRILTYGMRMVRGLKRRLKKFSQKLYFIQNKKEIQKMERIYFQ